MLGVGTLDSFTKIIQTYLCSQNRPNKPELKINLKNQNFLKKYGEKMDKNAYTLP